MPRRTSAPRARTRMAGPLAAALALVMVPSPLGCSPNRPADRRGPDIHEPQPAGLVRTGATDAWTVAAPASRPQRTRFTATWSPSARAGDDFPRSDPPPARASDAQERTEAALFILAGLLVGAGGVVIVTRFRSARKASPPSDDTRRRPGATARPAPRAVGATSPTRVLGYATVPPGEERTTSLDVATQAIGQWCKSHGRQLDRVVHDSEPAKRTGTDRPGLYYALTQVAEGTAAGVVCAHLGDISRSLPELGDVLRWFREADAFLVALDYDIDTSTASGATAARMLVEIGDWERERLTKDSQRALAASTSRPAVRDDRVLSARITEMRAWGMSLQAIADTLNAEGVPTKRGGARWRPSSVQAAAGYKRPPAPLGGIDLPPLPRDPHTDADREDTRT
jgi:DNA invertase Pin-like site-specific DNA recombinase